MVPPPRRGEVVRQIGERLARAKAELGLLVTLETGKIRSEGEGEVQEMIDMCDFAVGLSRQLYGLTIASERASPPHARAVAARWDRLESSRRSISRWQCGPGMRCSRPFAATL